MPHHPDRRITHLLVTGGAGFIGANFVHRTLATRPDVRITVLDAMTYAANPANLAGATETGVSVVVGDVCDTGLVDDLLSDAHRAATAEDGVAAVVHFAAESHNDNALRDPLRFVRTNTEGTGVVADACVRHGVHLHHISTDEVFGDLPLESAARFTVDTPYAPSSVYSASKAAADHLVRAFVRSHGLSATISNCSNNYGPRQHPEKFLPRQITGLINGESPRLYGAGDNVRDWIHVDDHNDAVWTILERGISGETYLIGADGERSNRQCVETLLRLFDRDPGDVIHVTDRPGHDRRYAIDPSSVEALGWEPRYTDFAAGLADTVQWYLDNRSWWEVSRKDAEETYRDTEQVID
ncbi:dTDP-glucose 4,6-dehydratase [Corynebacterium glyciniphilum]|uniref:dTDP-glucose 4,6-dehydratase n=1 Tax=Corynebacterium glyciniphilum TaxID=1404244 RepID=UPI00264FC294|nr:dTDP-glucose 4,6-dehydratase [Corynebacterium glyciniphilum]MDN5683235.1 dTDP-glucose 4,6-dehydratase [Corynebacterium glyciniphilum]MDN6705430.1 dTDP-glucose 4,6-dehydratase [Corynebacterium glyciniphilum]